MQIYLKHSHCFQNTLLLNDFNILMEMKLPFGINLHERLLDRFRHSRLSSSQLTINLETYNFPISAALKLQFHRISEGLALRTY